MIIATCTYHNMDASSNNRCEKKPGREQGIAKNRRHHIAMAQTFTLGCHTCTCMLPWEKELNHGGNKNQDIIKVLDNDNGDMVSDSYNLGMKCIQWEMGTGIWDFGSVVYIAGEGKILLELQENGLMG
jgi:hypothetical protein